MNRLACSLLVSIALAAGACGGPGGAPDAGMATCAAYCDEIAMNCTGPQTQYINRDECLAACATFPQGTPGAMSGNSLECRVYHTGAALGDPSTHCVHAGPAGGGLCGADCEGFCQLDMAACTGTNQVYTDIQQCLTQCQAFNDGEKFDVSDIAGDTVACRIYHASVALQDPATHCMHTRPVSSTCHN